MRKVLLIALLAVYALYGYSESYTAESTDTLAIVQQIVKFGNENAGGKISIIINALREAKIPIKVLDYDYTSPFIDPDGKGYLKRIVISYKEVTSTKLPIIAISINETNCEADHFEDDMHAYDGNGEERANRIKDLFTIKKVEFVMCPVDYSKKK